MKETEEVDIMRPIRRAGCKPFNASRKEDTCLWCGQRLRYAGLPLDIRRGAYGNGFFCTLRCGYAFRMISASYDHRLVRKEDS